MPETTAKYETTPDAFDELVKALNDLDKEIQDSKAIEKIHYLLTQSPKASELVPKVEDALKTCNLDYLNPRVDNLRQWLTHLKDMHTTPGTLACIGIDYLKKSVLDVLFEARVAEKEVLSVRDVEICQKIGMYAYFDKDGWLVATILKKLEEEGRVEQKVKGGPWSLTDAEYERLC